MRIALLNTSIVTTYGYYKYKPATIDDCRGLLVAETHNGTEIISAIGHESTAEIMSKLLNFPVKVNRIQYQQKQEDIAIVFKMNGRPPEGKILTIEEIEEIGYSFGILSKICHSAVSRSMKKDQAIKWESPEDKLPGEYKIVMVALSGTDKEVATAYFNSIGEWVFTRSDRPTVRQDCHKGVKYWAAVSHPDHK